MLRNRVTFLKKLEHYGINELVHGWIRSWLLNRSQRVIIDGAGSNEVSVRSGVPQGTVLGPLMFLIYINDIGEHITSNLRLFADDSLLYCAIDIPQDCLALQEDLDKLSQWSHKWQMSFNVSKCKSLSITRKRNPYLNQYTMNGQELESVKSHPSQISISNFYFNTVKNSSGFLLHMKYKLHNNI